MIKIFSNQLRWRGQVPPGRWRQKSGSAGFTLVEILVYMGLLTVFMFLLTSIFLSILETQAESVSTVTVEQESQYIMARMQYDLGRADEILTPPGLGDTSDEVVVSLDGQTVAFRLVGTQLQRQVGGDTLRLNATGLAVTTWQARRLGNEDGKHALEITMNVASIWAGGPAGLASKELTFTIGER
jgi:type II secretory pathway pseudopilin PulG